MNDMYFIHYTYYPDYLMRSMEERASITNPIRLEQQLLVMQGKVVVNLPLILDGGNVIITDRHIIMTEKVLFENHRGKFDNEKAISRQIIKKTKLEPIYITWDSPKSTGNKKVEKYGHIDWIVKYLGGESNVIVVAKNEEITRNVTESAIRKLEEAGCYDVRIFELEHPTQNSWAYLNFVQVEDVVLIPKVADPENDNEAEEKLKKLFEVAGHQVSIETIDCQDLIKEGGALNCISWNVKL